MTTLTDVLKALKELITVTEKVRDNTDRIVKLEEEFRAFREESRLSDIELKGDIKAILAQLKTEERIEALESLVREHIATCEKAKA